MAPIPVMNMMLSATTTLCNLAGVEVSLRQRLRGRVGNLSVDINERGMVLRGHAANYYAKQLAQHYAAEAAGLPVVANEIEVFWVH
jgi:hypothetical protein